MGVVGCMHKIASPLCSSWDEMRLTQRIRLLVAVLSSTDIHATVTTGTKLHIRQSECNGGCERCTLARQQASWPEQVPFICYSALFKALISILIQHFRSVDRELWYETKGVDPEEEEGVGIMTQVAQDMGGQEPDTHQIQRTFDAFFGNDSLNVPSARNAPQLDGRGIGNSQGADVVLPATMGPGMAPVERTLGLPPESNAVSNDFEEPSMGVDAGADQEMATVVGHTMS